MVRYNVRVTEKNLDEWLNRQESTVNHQAEIEEESKAAAIGEAFELAEAVDG